MGRPAKAKGSADYEAGIKILYKFSKKIAKNDPKLLLELAKINKNKKKK